MLTCEFVWPRKEVKEVKTQKKKKKKKVEQHETFHLPVVQL